MRFNLMLSYDLWTSVLFIWYEYTTFSLQIRANDIYDGIDEGYDSSRDEISSVSSYNPMREPFHRTFGSSLSLQSSVGRSGRSSIKVAPFMEGDRLSLSSNVARPQVSVAEVLYEPTGGFIWMVYILLNLFDLTFSFLCL